MNYKTEPKVIHSLSDLDPEGSYTYADYLRWEFDERVELIKGRLFKMSPGPNTSHQSVSQRINRFLLNYFYQKSCFTFAAPFDIRLPVGRKKGEYTTVVQPDLGVICDASKLDEKGCAGAPDLVIEILSPGNTRREMREKYEVYQESGVREYWLVNPVEKVVFIYILNNQHTFIGLAPAVDGDILRSHIFPELEVDLNEVFA